MGGIEMKVLWIDSETSGLSPIENDILTLALLVEIDGEIKDELYLEIQPTNWNSISIEALKINKLTIEQLKTFDLPIVAHERLEQFLSKWIDRYDKKDKFQPAGYNVEFDCEFLGQFFKKVGDKYYGAWVDYHKFDVATLVQLLALKKVIKLSSYKLVNVAKHFNIEFDAHNAMSDIKATRQLCYKILDRIDFK